MKYGCIGEHLSHSFSREIHNALADYEYEIKEIPRGELEAFVKARDFLGINVTIPYKELIIPYLDEIDTAAEKIGAVNTVVNRGGRLYGYNTDFYGMTALVRHTGISAEEKKVAILGSGGTSKTARAVFEALGAGEIICVSRNKTELAIDYTELYANHKDTEIIVNTTPVGMYPFPDAEPISLDGFDRLSGIIDAIYNPLRSRLIQAARRRGVAASGGLYMLVAQAVRASEIFLDKKYPEATLDKVYSKILRGKENIVLIGMPASGKTTVGGILAKRLSRTLTDTDELIIKNEKASIPDIFTSHGEERFRELESCAVAEAARETSRIIATGGGAVLRGENVERLSQNGRLYFIDRPPELLMPTSDRPTASDREKIKLRYRERYGIYSSVCDKKIDGNIAPEEVANLIIEDFL